MLAVLIGSTGVSFAKDVTDPSMLEKNIATLKETSRCNGCDLQGADLTGANLNYFQIMRLKKFALLPANISY